MARLIGWPWRGPRWWWMLTAARSAALTRPNRRDPDRHLARSVAPGAPGSGSQFFACGGHSLLATRLIARIRQAFQVGCPCRPSLPLRSWRIWRGPMTRLASRGSRHYLPLSLGNTRPSALLWTGRTVVPESTDAGRYHLPHPASFRLVGLSRRSRCWESPKHSTRCSNGMPFCARPLPSTMDSPSRSLPVAGSAAAVLDLTLSQWRNAKWRYTNASLRRSCVPLTWSTCPLQRTLLLRLSEEEHVLFLLWHHSISDGWSVGIFLRELSEVYAAKLCRRNAWLAADHAALRGLRPLAATTDGGV